MAMLKVYQLAGCPFALRTRIVLNEKRVPYEVLNIDRKAKPREMLEVSPGGTSPVIFDGEVRLRDSVVINEYLEERYPAPPLMPREPGPRGELRLLIDEVGDELGDALGQLVGAMLRLPAAERDPAAVESAREAVEEALGPWEARLAGREYLTGPFSLADVTLFTSVHGIRSLLPAALPEQAQALRAWLARLEARPSVQAALAATPAPGR